MVWAGFLWLRSLQFVIISGQVVAAPDHATCTCVMLACSCIFHLAHNIRTLVPYTYVRIRNNCMRIYMYITDVHTYIRTYVNIWHSMLLFLNFLFVLYILYVRIMHPFVTAPSSSLPLCLLGWFYAYLLMYVCPFFLLPTYLLCS